MRDTDSRSDSELYNSFRGGDTSAYDQLMIRYGDSLTMYLYGYIHDWQDSEDLMIEAFARIMAKRPRIGDGCFKAYLYKTGRNLAIRFHQNMAKVNSFSLEESEIDIADSEAVEGRMLDEEKESVLRLCLGKIEPELREAIWLVYFEDMSYQEAADVMKVNPKKIDHLLTRGRKTLKTELIKEGITGAYD